MLTRFIIASVGMDRTSKAYLGKAITEPQGKGAGKPVRNPPFHFLLEGQQTTGFDLSTSFRFRSRAAVDSEAKFPDPSWCV